MDRWWYRFQLEIGGRWQLLPDRNTSWRQWFFSPYWGLTLVGQRLDKPRQQLPEGVIGKGGLDSDDNGIDPVTNILITRWISRCFWLRAGCRLLGLDIGIGLFYRKKYSLLTAPGAPK